MKNTNEQSPIYQTDKKDSELKSVFMQEIILSMDKGNFTEKIPILSNSDAVSALRDIYPVDIGFREAFIVMHLNKQNVVIGYQTISIGGYSSTVVDVKMIFAAALKCGASAIILCHNHPSGNLAVSTQDKAITAKIKDICKLFDIDLLDHVILTDDDYTSFANKMIL